MISLPVIIIGANAFGIEVADILQKSKVIVYGFLDEDPKKKDQMIGEIPVLGSPEDADYWNLIGPKCHAFVAIENPKARKTIIEDLIEDRKTAPINVIHPSAIVAETECLSYGVFVGPACIIQPKSRLDEHVILRAGAIVETAAQIGAYAQIGAGALIGKEAQIENNAFIGDRACVVAGLKIGKGASVGAGSVCIENVTASQRVFGNPAKAIS